MLRKFIELKKPHLRYAELVFFTQFIFGHHLTFFQNDGHQTTCGQFFSYKSGSNKNELNNYMAFEL